MGIPIDPYRLKTALVIADKDVRPDMEVFLLCEFTDYNLAFYSFSATIMMAPSLTHDQDFIDAYTYGCRLMNLCSLARVVTPRSIVATIPSGS
ncbi:hypothetical protein ASE00_22675 [Sphingomonas sp. Root710]|nr:hypothetical protein ASE00_22675 [Sphingomonas sp. Root710]